MRRTTRLSLFFFILGFCTCLLLIVVVRTLHGFSWPNFKQEQMQVPVVFYKVGECPDCKVISTKFWIIGRLKDNVESHLESARRLGVVPFETNKALEMQAESLLSSGNLVALDKEAKTYCLKNLTHSYPYLVPKAVVLLDEIGVRFQAKLAEINLPPYYMMISSVLRTVESQQGLGKRNYNAVRTLSSHVFGTSFDISYKEFLPLHGKPAAEGYCRHDMLRHPLAEVLTEMSEEGKCKVVREVKQACFHITVNQ